MRTKFGLALLLLPFCSLAQQHSVTLSLGGVQGSGTDWGRAFGANYAYRVRELRAMSVFIEVPLWANPNRAIASRNPQASRDVASLFVTPGVRLSWRSQSRVSPFVVAGAGLAVYEQSALLQNGLPFPGDRTQRTGAVTYGGGFDVRVKRWLGFRGEVRDLYTGRPNDGVSSRRTHNPLLSAGFQIRFH